MVTASTLSQPDEPVLTIRRVYWDSLGSAALPEITYLTFHCGGKLEYGSTLFTASMSRWGGDWRYSFQGPIDILAYGLTYVTTMMFFGDSTKTLRSPAKYLFYLPNSFVNVKLYHNLKAKLGMNTEYLFYRDHSGSRGILFSPYAGLTLSGGYPGYWNGISVYASYSNMLSFDGPNSGPYWLLGLSVSITDIPH